LTFSAGYGKLLKRLWGSLRGIQADCLKAQKFFQFFEESA
jgi:hypothetical protein